MTNEIRDIVIKLIVADVSGKSTHPDFDLANYIITASNDRKIQSAIAIAEEIVESTSRFNRSF